MRFIKNIFKPYKEIKLLYEIIYNLENFLNERIQYAKYIEYKEAHIITLKYLKKQIEYLNNKLSR